jgi:hypothetical protein
MVLVAPQQGRRGWRQCLAVATQHGEEAGDAAVGCPGRQAEPTALAADPTKLERRVRLVSGEHDAEGRDDLVEFSICKWQAFRVAMR